MSQITEIPLNGQPFGQLAFTANSFLLDHMRRVRQIFGLELDIAFVFGSLAHLNICHKLHPLTPVNQSYNSKDVNEFRPVRLRDVVQVTGLPRETVRRHLLKLEQDHKIFQPQVGKWCLNPQAITPDMAGNTVKTIQNLLKTAKQLNEILEQSGLSAYLK